MSHIIPTLGPSIANPDTLSKLHALGVRILRFNFTHFTPTSAMSVITMIRDLNANLADPFLLMMDIEGPSIRTLDMAAPRAYTKGEKFRLIADPKNLEGSDIACDYPELINDVQIGSIVRIESGLFDTIVREKGSDFILLEAQNDFTLTSKRHINLPGIHVNQPTITDVDKQNLLFAAQEGFSYVAISFCRSADDIFEARDILENPTPNPSPQRGGEMPLMQQFLPSEGRLGGVSKIKLIAKIENQEGIDNLDKIVDASDLVMVARGDLGTELPLETIPEVQMHIVKTCKLKNTPVIVATQMMSSMVDNPTPTRAEVSDVFLAVREGADYLMLSEETTVGKYPLQVVEMMKKIAQEAQDFE